MSKRFSDYETDHHKPRKPNKKKYHRKGFSEDIQDKRQMRVSFKRYLRELEEELLDDELDEST